VATNDTAEVVRRRVPLNGSHLGLLKAIRYALIEWDLERGGHVVGEPLMGNEVATRGWEVELAPHQIKMLCLEPYKKPILLCYFADLGSSFAWVRSATDELLSAEAVMDGPLPGPVGYHGSPKYTMRGWPGVQFEMQLGYRPGHQPSYVAVTGTEEYAIRWKDGIIKVWGIQAGNVSIVIDPIRGGTPIAEGDVVSVSDAFQRAEVAYDSSRALRQKDWSLSGGWAAQRRTLHLDKPTAAPASVIWKPALIGDYQITFQTSFILATTQPLASHEASCPSPSLRFLVGERAGKAVWMGTDPATGRFPCVIEGGHSVSRGLDTALYPDPYWPEYLRAYDWRLRRRGHLLTLAISYDGGLTFEDLLPWMAGNHFTAQFGVACANAACTVRNITIKTERAM
jgi:hypothetical protein